MSKFSHTNNAQFRRCGTKVTVSSLFQFFYTSKSTGASIQVASEMLPNSTERAVTLSGKFDSIVKCFRIISNIMMEVSLSFYNFNI